MTATIATKTASTISTALGASARKTPSPVATPLPPLKRNHTVKMCPMMAQRADTAASRKTCCICLRIRTGRNPAHRRAGVQNVKKTIGVGDGDGDVTDRGWVERPIHVRLLPPHHGGVVAHDNRRLPAQLLNGGVDIVKVVIVKVRTELHLAPLRDGAVKLGIDTRLVIVKAMRVRFAEKRNRRKGVVEAVVVGNGPRMPFAGSHLILDGFVGRAVGLSAMNSRYWGYTSSGGGAAEDPLPVRAFHFARTIGVVANKRAEIPMRLSIKPGIKGITVRDFLDLLQSQVEGRDCLDEGIGHLPMKPGSPIVSGLTGLESHQGASPIGVMRCRAFFASTSVNGKVPF